MSAAAAIATPIQLVPKPDHAKTIAAAEERLQETFKKFLTKAGNAAAAAVLKQTSKLAKADDDPSDWKMSASAAYVAIDWEPLVHEIEEDIEEVVEAGALSGLGQISITDEDLFSVANTVARDYAHNRSAELVGMKYDADGNLVANPDAQWAISETTREDLRDLIEAAFEQETPITQLAQDIRDSQMFSEYRAEMIAATEVQRAQILGMVEIWKESAIVETVIWQVSSLGPCDECAENEDEEVKLGSVFPSGDQYPPVHPFCRCVLRPGKILD